MSFAASVAAETRGVHMSRFVESLHVWRNRIGVSTLSALLAELRERLDAQSAVARFDFPLFLERTGPVSGGGALVAYDCSLEGQLGAGRSASARSRHACLSRASAPAVARSATTAHTTSAAASRSTSAST